MFQRAKEAGLLPPSVTDEEESGSSTSSADETIGTRGPSSGANSAQSVTTNRNADFAVKSPGDDGDVKKESVPEDGKYFCYFIQPVDDPKVVIRRQVKPRLSRKPTASWKRRRKRQT